MLWLTGLMGLLAAGALSTIDFGSSSDDDEEKEDAVGTDSSDTSPNDPETSTDLSLLLGSDEDDELNGTEGDDTLYGEEGNDTINGNAGDDTLHGEDGFDLISGDSGDDVAFGHNDDDTIDGGAGNDTLQGSLGDDVLHGGDDDDAVHGGLDDDMLSGGLGNDSLFGGHGNDVISGIEDDSTTAALDDIDAGDSVFGETSDFLNGGAGDDLMIAGKDDYVTAGDGFDTIVTGDWITEGHATDISDFNADDDNILLVYDDEDPEPEITLQADPDETGTTHVLMNGIAVASVGNGSEISIDDIAVMPLSMAQSSGMLPL